MRGSEGGELRFLHQQVDTVGGLSVNNIKSSILHSTHLPSIDQSTPPPPRAKSSDTIITNRSELIPSPPTTYQNKNHHQELDQFNSKNNSTLSLSDSNLALMAIICITAQVILEYVRNAWQQCLRYRVTLTLFMFYFEWTKTDLSFPLIGTLVVAVGIIQLLHQLNAFQRARYQYYHVNDPIGHNLTIQNQQTYNRNQLFNNVGSSSQRPLSDSEIVVKSLQVIVQQFPAVDYSESPNFSRAWNDSIMHISFFFLQACLFSLVFSPKITFILLLWFSQIIYLSGNSQGFFFVYLNPLRKEAPNSLHFSQSSKWSYPTVLLQNVQNILSGKPKSITLLNPSKNSNNSHINGANSSLLN